MSDFPEEQLIKESPFSYCAVDYFGPFLVKEGRKIQTSWCHVHMLVQSRCSHTDHKQYDN